MAVSLTQSDRLMAELARPFDLAIARATEAHTFQIQTRYGHFSSAGKKLESHEYTLRLSCGATAGAPCTCHELTVRTNDGTAVGIAELTNWSYVFDSSLTGADERGPLWGIPQERFAQLTDNHGAALPFSVRYAAYVSLIDFHSINDVFSRPMPFGPGIQDLKEIGQRVIHPASFIEAPVQFGKEILPGSTFKNGRVTLEFAGVGIFDGAPCALVAYDAGESTLKMLVALADGAASATEGGSQYKGVIHIDLRSGWVRRATLEEHLIAQANIGTADSRSTDYTARHIELRLVA